MKTLSDYVLNINNRFLYSQQAIDLVKQYLDKFPRVFELVASNSKGLSISDLAENNNTNGLEYLAEIRQWLGTLPHFKETQTPNGSMHLSEDAINEVVKAVNDAVSITFCFVLYFQINCKSINPNCVILKGQNGASAAQDQMEVAKHLCSRFEQCFGHPMSRRCLQTFGSHRHCSQWIPGMTNWRKKSKHF